jgi:hypothetical protein
MRIPKLPEPTITEGLIYVFISLLAAAVIAGAATKQGDPVSPDFRLTVAEGAH